MEGSFQLVCYSEDQLREEYLPAVFQLSPEESGNSRCNAETGSIKRGKTGLTKNQYKKEENYKSRKPDQVFSQFPSLSRQRKTKGRKKAHSSVRKSHIQFISELNDSKIHFINISYCRLTYSHEIVLFYINPISK